MDFLTELKEQDNILTNEAIEVLYRVVGHYGAILDNIIKIKQQTPVEGEGFRRKSGNVDLLSELAESLKGLKRDTAHVEQVFTSQQATAVQCNKQILKVLSKAIERCVAAYEGKARSFAMILQDLEKIEGLFKERLILRIASKEDLAEQKYKQNVRVNEDEKLVYVRVFHREMAKLGVPNAPLAWARPLLESVKFAEKSGLAIYGSEEAVKKTLKNDSYGYVTLKVNQEQDTSSNYPEKTDPTTGATLLTIANVRIEQIMKLTHAEVDYPVIEGRLRPPKSTG